MMTDDRWADVDRYITDLHVTPDDALQHAVNSSASAGLPPIAVSATQGKLLFLLARMQRARAILEIGTLGGFSTIWLARGLEPGGRLITLEIDPKHASVASENIARAGLSGTVEVRVGRAQDLLPTLADESQTPFDLVFIDADKASIPQYFEWALKMSRVGTLIIVDNVIRSGAVVDATSTDPNIIGVRAFNDVIAGEPRVTSTTIQMVGIKGYDGMAFVLVTA